MEALFYNKLEDNKVECTLCPHNCKLNPAQTGVCLARENQNGTLIATAYGKLCSVSVDPIEKKPLNHFLPHTLTYSIAMAGCNLKCTNCQNDEISQHSCNEIAGKFYSPNVIVQLAYAYPSISYTYTEPLIFFEFVLATAKLAHQAQKKNIIVSNGYINEKPLRMLAPYLDAANIDLKVFDDKLYKQITKGSLEPVLNTLKILKASGVWVEITNLIIPNHTDDMNIIRKMCEWLVVNGFSDNPLHFSRFFPRYKMMNIPVTPKETLLEAKEIAKNCGINYVYLGNI
jgi:pyruvate formate lyase activating enzyme